MVEQSLEDSTASLACSSGNQNRFWDDCKSEQGSCVVELMIRILGSTKWISSQEALIRENRFGLNVFVSRRFREVSSIRRWRDLRVPRLDILELMVQESHH